MYRNPFWILFLSVMVIGTVIYTGFTVYDLWHYMRLDKHIQAQDIQWSVLALSDDRFIPVARYQFILQGKYFQGETRWQANYLNEWTAKEAVARLKPSPPLVWYDGANPNISTLEKLLPQKQCLYTVSLWILSLYFFGLGYYVNGRLSS